MFHTKIGLRRGAKLPRINSSSPNITFGVEGKSALNRERSSTTEKHDIINDAKNQLRNSLVHNPTHTIHHNNSSLNLLHEKRAQPKTFHRLLKEHTLSVPSTNNIPPVFTELDEVVIMIDEDGFIVKWDKSAEQLFGWTEESVNEISIESLITEFDKFREYLQLGSTPISPTNFRIEEDKSGIQETAPRRLFISKTGTSEIRTKEGSKYIVEITLRADKQFKPLSKRSNDQTSPSPLSPHNSRQLFHVIIKEPKFSVAKSSSPKNITSFTSILSRKNSKTDLTMLRAELSRDGSFEEMTSNKKLNNCVP